MTDDFGHIVSLIRASRQRAYQSVNAELVNLYWQIGRYIHHRVAAEAWGKGVVKELAAYIATREPGGRGFSDKNLWRMKQFYETYAHTPLASVASQDQLLQGLLSDGSQIPVAGTAPEHIYPTVLAQVSWTHHLIILSGTRRLEEKLFYLLLCVREGYSKRELQRQLDASLFERTMLTPAKLSPLARVLPEALGQGIKDRYVFEFLDLPEQHNERDLQKAIITHLRQFLLEFSRDFAFLGEEFVVQVGNKDYAIDLLFYNRALNCLVAIELKVVDFAPEFLGKLNFYLEALDRDVKKPHENPSIGILLCKAQDSEVVEYAMSRQMSPAMVAQYELQLPDKQLLQAKLHEFFALNDPQHD